MSPTYSGRIQDVSIARQEQCTFPDAIRLFKDLGYQGYIPDNILEMAPIKKPKGRALSTLQKWYNTAIAKVRVTVEHAIAGIKRCRIIKERCRLHYNNRNRYLLLATALHNLRVVSPHRNYQTTFKTRSA